MRHNASIMRHMSTANVARDMDLLRQALGDGKLNFYGASYGSYLGNVYARQKRYDDALRELNAAQAADPGNPSIREKMDQVRQMAGK